MDDIKIAMISDLHGKLPVIPECDLLLIGGDVCPTEWSQSKSSTAIQQSIWLSREFNSWLKKQPVKETVLVWGNHDWIGQITPELVPELQCHILTDKSIELFGLKIYGTPWQPYFYDWAFNAHEEQLKTKWDEIPKDTDILVLHGPPYGHGDLAYVYPREGDKKEHTGSPSLTTKITQLEKIKLVVCGHIHPARGISYIKEKIPCCNVAVVDERYQLVHEPMVANIKNGVLEVSC